MPHTLTRRQLLAWSAAAGGGFAVGFALPSGAAAPSAPDPAGRPFTWLTLHPDGSAELAVPIADLGQGALTGISQLVAEELDLPVERFRIRTADYMPAVQVRADGAYTGGSSSIRELHEAWRRLGAGARACVLQAAARRWGVRVAQCHTDVGRVLRAGHEPLGYGELAAAIAAGPVPVVPSLLRLRPRAEWRVIGRSVPSHDAAARVDGSARYGIDVRVPGMRTATLAQCPVYGGRLARVDPTPALAIGGVRAVLPFEDFVAVVADGYWPATRGLEALRPEWNATPVEMLDDARLSGALAAAQRSGEVAVYPEDARAAPEARRVQIARALAEGTRIERSYEGQLLAHATLEPQNATARVADGRAELWVPSQDPAALRDAVARALGYAPERIVVHPTLLGGGFGRRLASDYAVQAARIAQAAGVPVKLIWSRSEDLQHDPYRPAARTTLTAAVGADGLPRLIHARGAATNDRIYGGLMGNGYGIATPLVELTALQSALPNGAWRSVDASLNGFFLESFVDELAEHAGADPLAYRLRLLAGAPRGARVLREAARLAGYAASDRSLGVAVFKGWETWVATIARVALAADGTPRVVAIACAVDCGTAVNPGLVRGQIEGGIVMGLSAALHERVRLRDGRAVCANFDDYRLLTISECPRIDVALLESPDAPIGGVGEPPVPAVAPAVANAICRLTGRRLRRLPLLDEYAHSSA